MLRSTGLLVLLLILFFLFKMLRFQTLAYTFHDMYVFLQMASGWLDGRPFMYDNFWGDHQRIHNYYTVWVWGPICYVLGAYGLFLIQSVLLLIAYGLTNQRLAKSGVPSQMRYGLLVVILLGPTSAWLNDHTSMGWHSELTYLPFGILFVLALTGKGRGWAMVAGLGVTLVKEDGAVLAAMIHLTYFGVTYLRQHPDRDLWKLVAERRFWFISIGWGVVFIAGMAWLSYLNNSAEPRLQGALSLAFQNVNTTMFWLRAGKEAGAMVLLLLPAGCFMLLLISQLTPSGRQKLIILYGLGIAVLSVVNFVQSSLYYGPTPAFHLFGMTWPPRFVLPWTFTVAFLMIVLLKIPLNLRFLPAVPAWLVLGSLVLIQIPILYVVRPDLPRLAELNALIHRQISPTKESQYVQSADLAKIQCLADRLPARSNVMAFEYVLPYFHKHYVVWPTGNHYQAADLALIPIDDKQNLRKGLIIRQPYQIIRLKGYYLYVATDYQQAVQQCIRQ